MGKTHSFENGRAAIPLNAAAGLPRREIFNSQVIGLSAIPLSAQADLQSVALAPLSLVKPLVLSMIPSILASGGVPFLLLTSTTLGNTIMILISDLNPS